MPPHRPLFGRACDRNCPGPATIRTKMGPQAVVLARTAPATHELLSLGHICPWQNMNCCLLARWASRLQRGNAISSKCEQTNDACLCAHVQYTVCGCFCDAPPASKLTRPSVSSALSRHAVLACHFARRGTQMSCFAILKSDRLSSWTRHGCVTGSCKRANGTRYSSL